MAFLKIGLLIRYLNKASVLAQRLDTISPITASTSPATTELSVTPYFKYSVSFLFITKGLIFPPTPTTSPKVIFIASSTLACEPMCPFNKEKKAAVSKLRV